MNVKKEEFMKKKLLLILAGASLIASTALAQNDQLNNAHQGNVRTAQGLVLGQYRLVSVSNSSELKLPGLTCKLSRKSLSIPNSARTIYGTSVAADVVNVSECYPGSASAVMTVIQDAAHSAIYSFAVSISNTIPNSGRFVNHSQGSFFVSGGECTTQGNRLTCNLEDGGNVILDLL
jgi:hypothetical protein